MSIVLFEDALVSGLDPVTIGKPAFAIQCGGYRLVDLAGMISTRLSARVRPHLRGIVAADCPNFQTGGSNQATLWINARLVPSIAVHDKLRRLLLDNQPGIVLSGTTPAAALVPAGMALGTGDDALPTPAEFAALGLPTLDVELPLF